MQIGHQQDLAELNKKQNFKETIQYLKDTLFIFYILKLFNPCIRSKMFETIIELCHNGFMYLNLDTIDEKAKMVVSLFSLFP